jgi:hypothetical protein
MPAKKEINWDWDRLQRLWHHVVKKLGSYGDREAGWWVRSTPDPELQLCLEEFVTSEGFASKTWTAAYQQLKFGATSQKTISNASNARTWIRNHAAAIEAAFLETKHLPKHILANKQQ